MAEYTDEISKKLITALEVVMDLNATRENRAEANEFLDNFKDSSPLCANCGFHLVSQSYSPVVRHYGLFLIDHCIKYQWDSMSLERKLFVKDNIMKILADGTLNILEEQYHIKNALAKSVVEIVKREWPQQWPKMLVELFQLSNLGETQTELTLLIFLHLAEDVVTLQNVPVQRRRQIYQGLTSNLADILAYFTAVIMKHVPEYFKLAQILDDENQFKMNVHCRVAMAALTTLVEYLDWIPVNCLITDDGILLKMFCELLEDSKLKYSAVECLWVVSGRKGKPDDRKPLLVLFDQNAMAAIFKAAQTVNEGSIQEQGHTFLKRLCQVLTNLGNILCSLLGVVSGVELPQNFSSYLDAMLSLAGHDSQVLSSYAISLWCSLFRHEHLSVNPILTSFIPRIVEVLSKKLIKVGFPSWSDSLSSTFSSLDFDCDDDFNTFFLKFRTECSDALRLATTLAPQVTFEHAAFWLQNQLRKPIDLGVGNNTSLCTLSSRAYLEWDALAVCLESVLSRIFATDSCKILAEKGIGLLEEVLMFQTQDPLILSAALSCMSALFVFLKYAPQALPSVLNRIFSTIVFSLPGQTKSSRSRAVKNVRRHACSCFVKICKTYPEFLLPLFDKVYENVRQLSVDAEQLSQMEKCTLTEALILISNQFQNYKKQNYFLKEVLAPVSAIWLHADMLNAFSSTDNFLSYVGLDRPPVEPSTDDLHGINRSQIISCSNTILAVIKRSACPRDLDTAREGGFVFGITESGASVMCNPAMDPIISLLPPLFNLLRILNSLCNPEVTAKISSQYTKANDMLDCNKNNVLGVAPPSIDVGDVPHTKPPLERMQSFLTAVHDNCYHILGSCCQSLGHGFYTIPNLVDSLITSIFTNINQIPDYRLRPAIRVFMKPFVQCCPPELYRTSVIPVLTALIPIMYQRLSQKWAYFDQCLINSKGDEDNAEAQEVLEEQLHRQVTKEYLDLLVAVLQGKKCQTTFTGDMMEEDDDCHPSISQVEVLGELGRLIFQFQDLYPAIVLCIFSAVSWNDTTACIKASMLCLPIIKQLVSDSNFGADEAQHLMTCILMGLRQHGQHEMNVNSLLALGLQAYEVMRPIHPTLANLMLQIPGCSAKDVTKSVGEMFSRKVLIKELPPLFCPIKTPPADPIERQDFAQSICTLFKSDSNGKDISTS